jgi:hypothetical protein
MSDGSDDSREDMFSKGNERVKKESKNSRCTDAHFSSL